MKEETVSDWIDSGKYLPGEKIMGEQLLVDDGNGVEVIRWVGISYNRLSSNSKWKILPPGFCTECGAGPKDFKSLP